jgi:predicted transcriptional regulator
LNGGVEKITLYISAHLQRALRSLARREGRPQAEIIRAALNAYVRQQQRPRLVSVGLGEDDHVSGATSEDYLRSRWRAG